MSQPSVTVHAEWDDEVRVWVISSDDVAGLHIEAGAYDEIEVKVAVALADLAELDPAVARLSGRPLDIHTTRHAGRVAFA